MYESTFIGGPVAGKVFHTTTAPTEMAFTGMPARETDIFVDRHIYERTYLIEPKIDTGVVGQAFYAYKRSELIDVDPDDFDSGHTGNLQTN